jgi:hypothetical protein
MNNMEKGKTAEKIIENMFKEAGFKVIKYGYEYTVPGLADGRNPIQGLASQYIRHQPDFIVVNKRNEAFFVEVKFRTEGILKNKDLFPYPNCYVLLLTRDMIMAQSTKYLYKRGVNFQNITKMPPFAKIPYDIIDKYVKKLRRTLGDETFIGQKVEGIVKKITGKKMQGPKPTYAKFDNDNKHIVKKYRCNSCGRIIKRQGNCSPCNIKLKQKRGRRKPNKRRKARGNINTQRKRRRQRPNRRR